MNRFTAICTLRSLVTVCAITMLVYGAPFFAHGQEQHQGAAVKRVLNFKCSKPLGMLFLEPIAKQKPTTNGDEARNISKKIAPAIGTVTVDVPPGWEILLDANQKFVFDPTSIQSLNPADIEALIIQASAAEDRDIPMIHHLIQQLGQFKNLKELYFERSDLTDKELALLPVMPSLEVISLFENYGISGTCLEQLSRFPNLRYLSFFLTQVDKSNLHFFTKMQKLVALHLGVTRLQAGALKPLVDCPNIRYLWLNGNPNLGKDDIKCIGSLKHLEWLDLRRCKLTDADLAPLTNCKSLKKIALNDNALTANGLMQLRSLHLDELQVSDNGFDKDQMSMLHSLCKNLFLRESKDPRAKPDKDLLKIFAPLSDGTASKR
ncbi:MAG TPA: hypothetical protein V6C97_35950 [Oculatellaceae cyanobacterium]